MSVFRQESIAHMTQKNHQEFEERLRNSTYEMLTNLFEACQSNCYTCLNIIIASHARHGMSPDFLPNYLYVWKKEFPIKNAHYHDFIQYIQKLKIIMPLLVGVHKQDILPFCKHPLYTRDVLRAILRLACSEPKEGTP